MLKLFKKTGAAFVIAAILLPNMASSYIFSYYAYPTYCQANGGDCPVGIFTTLTDEDDESGTELTVPATVRLQVNDDETEGNSMIGARLVHVGADSNKYCNDLEIYTASAADGPYTLRSTNTTPTKTMGGSFNPPVLKVTHIQFVCNSVVSGTTWAPGEAYNREGGYLTYSPSGTTSCNVSSSPCDSGFLGNAVRNRNLNDGYSFSSLPVEYVFSLDQSYTVSSVALTHNPTLGANANQFCDYIGVYASSDGVDFSGSATELPDGGEFDQLDYLDMDFPAPVSNVNYLKLECLGVNSGTTWDFREFSFDGTPTGGGGTVPEMGVWAIIAMLPVLGYLAYSSNPKQRLTTA